MKPGARVLGDRVGVVVEEGGGGSNGTKMKREITDQRVTQDDYLIRPFVIFFLSEKP